MTSSPVVPTRTVSSLATAVLDNRHLIVRHLLKIGGYPAWGAPSGVEEAGLVKSLLAWATRRRPPPVRGGYPAGPTPVTDLRPPPSGPGVGMR